MPDGDSYYFHIKAVDGALNWNKTAYNFGPLMIDTVAPTNTSILINNDQAYTNSKIATLNIAGNDARSGMGSMAFSNDGTIWPTLADWETWTSPRNNWDLTDINRGGNDNDGVKTVYMKSKDKAGNLAPNTVSDTIFLDRKLPVNLNIKINDGADYTNSASVTLALTATDPDPASGLFQMRFSNDGTTWSAWESWNTARNAWSLTAGAGGTDTDGKKVVYFEVMDKAGNIGGPVSDDIYMDRSAPSGLTITINGGEAYTNVTDVKLNVTAQDAVPGSGLDKMQFSNDDSTFSSWEDYTSIKNPWSLTLGAGGKDQDGLKPVYFQAKDKVSNIGGPAKNVIFLDRVSPTNLKISINNGATLTNKVGVSLNMSATDPDPGSGLDVMKIQEVGSPWSDWMPWQSPYSFTVSNGDGSKTVCFMVRDKAKNQAGPACDSIVLDTTPPTISNIKVIAITDISAIVTWSTDSPADGTVDYGTTTAYPSQQKDATMDTTHGITLTGLTPTTTYHFRVASTDEVGNGPTVSGDNTFTTTATPDRTPPIITNLRVDGITDVYALVLWETNEPADSYVHYGITPDCPLIAGANEDVRDHSISLTGLLPDTNYYVIVQSTDPSGNGPVNATTQFRTGKTPDTTPPVITNVQVGQLSDKIAVITWSTDEIANSVVEYGETGSYGKVVTDAGFVKDHIMTLSGLSPATKYFFIVRSTDPSGNGPTTSAQYYFQTAIMPDTTPPAITNVRASGITNTMAIISWSTDELADSSVQYGTSTAYGQKADDITFGMAHELTLVGLKPATTYHFKVLSKDMAGNTASSTDVTFTTLTVEDKEPPIITDVNVQGISTDVAVVVWKTNEVADSSVDFGTSTIYGMTARDDRFITDHSVVLKGLTANTTYHFHVKSTDVSGNGPTVSADVIFKTIIIKDTTPPNITNVAISGITSSSATVTWNTNEPASTLLFFAENGTQGAQAGDSDHYLLNHTWSLSGLKPNTVYWVKAISVDPSGNKGETATVYKFTTAKGSGGGGGGGGKPPTPFSGKQDWTWVYIAILICVIAGVLGAVYYFKTRKPTQPIYGATRGRAVPQDDEAYQVEEMQMDDEGVQTVEMAPDDEEVPTMAMDGDEGVETLDMGEDDGMGATVSAVTSLSPPRSRKPVKTVKCPGCKSAIPIFSETQTDIKCPSCGKEGRIKPMKAPPPVREDTEDLTPLGSVLGSEPDLPVSRPPPKAPAKPARQAAPPAKVPLKTLTCSGCHGKVPIYTDKRPIKITCPNCGKGGTLKN